MKKEPITCSNEWTFELLEKFDQEIARIAHDFALDTYPAQIEIISTEQMLDAYASIGMPLNYHHWSFGKKFVESEKQYKQGHMGLAYEIVINSNPSIAYLLEENSLMMQVLVIAHACYGHNSFFKNNYLFTTWTTPESIIDYLLFAKNYIAGCEERYGISAVEDILDACHALMANGVDRYKRPAKISLREEKIRQKRRQEYLQTQVNDLWRTVPPQIQTAVEDPQTCFPKEPEENILYFIEKHAPLLEGWQREIIRITRKIAQYFYPQKQTQVMNEGWACFWHYTIIHALYDEGLLTDEFMLEFLQTHTNIIYQPDFDSPHYTGINPYALGYRMMMDIKRICENPSDEDRQWFPSLVGTDWRTALDFGMRHFKDESFISQYLSPHLIRDMRLFTVLDDDRNADLIISAIHDEAGYQRVRAALSEQYNLGSHEPNIQVYNVNLRGDRCLQLRHSEFTRKPLEPESAQEVLKHLHSLWHFDVQLESIKPDGSVSARFACPHKS